MENIHSDTVASFGAEWSLFTQSASSLSDDDRRSLFESYFSIFPWDTLPKDTTGIDVGCGSGRWAALVAPRVGKLYAADPSRDALAVAECNLVSHHNVEFINSPANDIPLPAASLDFGYCLGVLHHVPDTQSALNAIAAKLKPGAPFLLYLYYSFDNKPWWYRALWCASDLLRRIVSAQPRQIKAALSTAIAATLYFPLARSAQIGRALNVSLETWPLSFYCDKSFYVMRTDSYDRFCTPLEKRFSRVEIERMMLAAGFGEIAFSDRAPYWVAVGKKQ
jgi:SAM-dependent methyltransferase